MRKEIKSKNRRKWIVGGAVFFGGVALLTTGFATWIVGVQQTSTNNATKISVDTAKDSTIYLATTLTDDQLFLREGKTTQQAAEIMHSDQVNDTDVADLQITFSTIKVNYGKDSGFNHTKIAFEFADWDADETHGITADHSLQSTLVQSAGNLIGSKRTGTAPWTYIDVPAAITLPAVPTEVGESDVDGAHIKVTNSDVTITWTNKAVDFSWGTFFDKKAPTAYYNGIYSALTLDDRISDKSAVIVELTAMYTALNDKTLTLVTKLA